MLLRQISSQTPVAMIQWEKRGRSFVFAWEQTVRHRLHEVIQEVLVAVLVARLCEVVFRHHIVIGMGLLP
jgi:hypothetical protein